MRVVERRRRVVERQQRRGRLIRRSLISADLVALIAVYAIVEMVVLEPVRGADPKRIAFYAGFGAALLGIMALHGLYGRDEVRADHSTIDDFASILHAVTLGAFGSLLVTELTGGSSSTAALVAWATALICIPVARVAARMFARRRPGYLQKTLILGAGDIGQLMARKLQTHPEYGLQLEGFIDAAPRRLSDELAEVEILGGPGDIPALVRQHRIERVIVAFSRQSHVEELDTIRTLKDLDLQVDIVPRLFEVVGPNADINVFEGLSVFALPPLRLSRGNLIVKRALDLSVAGLGLVLAAPLMAGIALAIKLGGSGPVIYRGTRIGPRGRSFQQLKFRTMDPHSATPEGEAEFAGVLRQDDALRFEFATTQKLEADPRVTPVGRWLRRTSLDELPQLFNILRGDLSLVGPRPISESELHERYKPRILDPLSSEALLVGYWDSPGLRPGLTGYWQISGRSTMSFDERIRLDTAYLTSWSLKLDVAILAKTARALFATRGAY